MVLQELKQGYWKPWQRYGVSAVVVVTLGVLVIASPHGQSWEEDLGLTWLFRLRGPSVPPPDVAIVSFDRISAERLSLPRNPRKWPRDLHGELVDRLTDAGASVIVFDVQFQESRDPLQDQAFGAALRRARNVVLFQLLERDIRYGTDGGEAIPAAYQIEALVPPIPVLAESAVAQAPFVLPKVRAKVSQVWLFKQGAGDAPTLPVVALHIHATAVRQRLLELIRQMHPDAYTWLSRSKAPWQPDDMVSGEIRALRSLFLQEPGLASRLRARIRKEAGRDARRSDLLDALVFAYGGKHSMHLNFYGPPQTIETIPYHRVIQAAPGDLDVADRAIFVGAAARMQPGQRDGFYTTYTQESGLDVSGVEIAATTFANLLARHPIVPLGPGWQLLLLVGWGAMLTFLMRRVPGGWTPVAALSVGVSYVAVAYGAFFHLSLWVPLVTPILIQLPIATFAGVLWRYTDMQQERENIRRAFGRHLPIAVVDEIARGIDDFSASAKQAFGICLATDAENFTTLAEGVDAEALRELMNDYFGTLFPAVTDKGGVVADVVGDSMLAVWAGREAGPELKRQACAAALDVLDAVDTYNARHPKYRLPTRVGLHCGDLVMGYIGAADRHEYRAVGDIVNTANRIEGLCKYLGTPLLASGDLVRDLDGFNSRELGRFLLKGKSRPLSIYEVLPRGSRTAGAVPQARAIFAEGLESFRAADWAGALRCFDRVEKEFGPDAPSRFYARICRRHLVTPPEGDWTGTIRVAAK